MADKSIPITIQLPQSVYDNLVTVVKNCNITHRDTDGATTHGELDIAGLLLMVAEDVAMTNSRPGLWEGSNMQQVLDSHGYH
jgi:hypothetical protein